MRNLTTGAIFFLAAGILTSVSILSVYQVLFTIPLCYYTYLAFKNKELKLPKSAYWLLAFTVIALISLMINIELVPKPSKNFGRLKYFLFGLAGIFVLRVWLVEASDRTKKILNHVFLTTIILAALFSFWSYFTKDSSERVRSFTDTMRYGYGSSMILVLVLSAILQREKLKNVFDARLGIAALILGFIGMYLTYTRGALLAFICATPFVLYYYRPKLGLIVGGGAAILVTILASFYLFGNIEIGQGSRFLVNRNNHSDLVRRSQWKAAVIAVQERPMLGWGLSNFHSQLKRIKNDYDLDAKEYDDAHAHNLFLEIAAGTGLLGIFLFLGWLLSWAWEVFSAGGIVRALVLPFGVTLMVGSQFEVTFDANNASMIFFLYSLSVARLVKKV